MKGTITYLTAETLPHGTLTNETVHFHAMKRHNFD